MLRQRLSQRNSYKPYENTPISRYYVKQKPIISEWTFAVYGLVLSSLVILAKVLYANREALEKVFLETKLTTYEVFSEDHEVMFTHSWKTVVRYSSFWLPLLCGLLSTYFTWIMVYLDSNVPGIQPPSPLSPKRYKDQSGHTFHLNYVFALLIGALVFLYTYWKGFSLEYE